MGPPKDVRPRRRKMAKTSPAVPRGPGAMDVADGSLALTGSVMFDSAATGYNGVACSNEVIMTPVVAIIAPGAMGAGTGQRLTENGVKVLTSLKGRSAATAARAKAAGMADASDAEIAATDFILSILPPGDALKLAERLAPALQASNAKPVYVD